MKTDPDGALYLSALGLQQWARKGLFQKMAHLGNILLTLKVSFTDS
jgi:hypothetical protein